MNRGAYKSKAVLLNSVDYSESDRILTFYTLEYGKMSGIAKGARRSRRRFVANIDPLCNSTLLFFHNGKSDLVRVDDATLIDGHAALKADIDKYSIGCYMLELVSEMTREGHAMPDVYRLLRDFLGLLDISDVTNGEPDDALLRSFEIKLLSYLGYLPHLNGCVECSEPIAGASSGAALAAGSATLFFSSERGGAVCAPCGNAIGGYGDGVSARRDTSGEFSGHFLAAREQGSGGLQPVSTGTVKWLSAAARLDSKKLNRLKTSPVFLKEGERLLGDFIRHQIGRELKTKKFMYKLRGMAT